MARMERVALVTGAIRGIGRQLAHVERKVQELSPSSVVPRVLDATALSQEVNPLGSLIF